MKKTAIGIVLIALSIAGMLWWELVGRDSVMYTEVLTLSRDADVGTEITRDMLEIKKTTTPTLRSLRLSDAQSVIGKETVSYIPKGAELFSEFFEDGSLVVHEELGQYIFSIPSSWLVSYPQTLRRGDKITLLLVKDEEEPEYSGYSEHFGLDGFSEGGPFSAEVPQTKPQEPENPGPSTGDEILTTTVIYVKSSTNNEVVSDSERLDAAATVSIIEVIAQKEEAQMLTKLASDGGRFVVLYQ